MSNTPAHNIQDCTKLKCYKLCPRKYYFEFIRGWHLDAPEHDLWFGIAVHKGFEKLYELWKEEGPGYDKSRVGIAWAAFLECYRERFPESTDEDFRPKDPTNVLDMFLKYAQTYSSCDNFSVDFTEVSGQVIVGEHKNGDPLLLAFRLDTFCKDEKGKRFILEHKTSKWSSFLWGRSFDHSMQVGMGQHVLDMCFPEEEVFGVVINGLLFRNPPRFKKNGEPYANSGPGNEVQRLPKQWCAEKKMNWLSDIQDLMQQVFSDFELLEECKENDPFLKAFPRNENSCFVFNRLCPYADLCLLNNPLRIGNEAPIGFVTRHWNPLEEPSDSKFAAKMEDGNICCSSSVDSSVESQS